MFDCLVPADQRDAMVLLMLLERLPTVLYAG
jgi:hypothetical protein